jgi:Xaa-Pro aminopeptidase
MRKIAILLVPFDKVKGPTSVIVAGPAPRFTDAERHAELAKRRAAVAAKMADNSVLILFSAEPRLYTNDVDYVYRQENNLYYLTALKQDGATFVMTKKGGTVTETLFLPKRVPLREAWEGKMYSREQATARSGLVNMLDASEKDSFLKALMDRTPFTAKEGRARIATDVGTVYMLLSSDDGKDGNREYRVEKEFAAGLTGYKVEDASPIFAALRLIKSPYELKLLQHAVDISNEGHMRAMAMVGRANWEYEVHAELDYTFRRRNADNWGYPSIVGCGPNATTLHYVESQSPVKHGDVMLIDAAAEYDHYTADITRSYPVNGKFTKEQAEIYQIVYDAQEAVAKATKPGVTWQQLNAIARSTINEGLFKLGLVLDKNSLQVGIWSFHGLGHWIGMNVHDVGEYGVLKPGMVYTNEPGIYIREDALDNLPKTPENLAFIAKVRPTYEKYKNIGVRIEDDMLVTENGVEWMSAKLPRSIADIEAFMASASKQPLSRTPSTAAFPYAFAGR